MSITIYPVPPKSVAKLWGKLEPFVGRALAFAQGEFLSEDIGNSLKNGNMQAWMVCEDKHVLGLFITEVIEYPRFTSLRVVTTTGTRFDSWSGVLDACLTKFAAEQGCSRIEATGRRGWVRKMADFGYIGAYTTVVKNLVPREAVQ